MYHKASKNALLQIVSDRLRESKVVAMHSLETFRAVVCSETLTDSRGRGLPAVPKDMAVSDH